MPERTFKLEIVTPEQLVYSADVASVVAPGTEGSLGVLAGHAPMVVELTVGRIWLRDVNGNESSLATSGGFMQVRENLVRILADTAELACDIDVERAEEARRRASERLRSGEEMDQARAEVALKRAVNRIRVARGE
ncbi:MAG: F0F1 ATP synthase subunit epsilon [Armatimonadota bacterium]